MALSIANLPMQQQGKRGTSGHIPECPSKARIGPMWCFAIIPILKRIFSIFRCRRSRNENSPGLRTLFSHYENKIPPERKQKALPEYMVVLFSNILKIYAFYPSFPPAGSVVGGFYWLFLWNFKEIKHQPFSMAQPNKKTQAPRTKPAPYGCLSVACPCCGRPPLSAASRAPGPSSDPSC